MSEGLELEGTSDTFGIQYCTSNRAVIEGKVSHKERRYVQRSIRSVG
jgi:hypothetical protein